jgi:hypothetical protein
MSHQYPHFLFVFAGGNAVQDPTTGNLSTPTGGWVFHSECREETNGKGATVMGPDGKALVFSSDIFLPLEAERIAEGSEILVSETESADGFTRIKGKVLKFNLGQFNRRIWV